MTVLVTGASGLLGARVVRALHDLGRPVRAHGHRRAPPDAAATVRGDLRDPRVVREAVLDVSAVVHCAAALDPVASEREADEVNHRATRALARAAADAGASTFVFVSSQAAIGWRSDAGLVAEDAECAPTTAYGRSKRDAERALLESPGSGRVVVVRPPTLYGPGERRNFLALARAAATGLFPVPGRGDNRMSFCHLENAVEAVLWALDAPAASGVFHIADARPVTLRQTVDTIARAAGRRPVPVPFPLPVARVAAHIAELTLTRPPLTRARLHTLTSDCALDTRRAAGMGFAPRVGFAEGVRETLRSYRADGVLGGWDR